jgi:phage portal protein BeeE
MRLMERLGFALRLATGRLKQADAQPIGEMMAGLVQGKTSSYLPRNSAQLIDSYNTSPWVHACACRIADSMAAVAWRLYVVRGRGTQRLWSQREVAFLQRAQGPVTRRKLLDQVAGEAELQEVRSHLLLDVLHKANSEMTGLELRWLTSVWLDLVGDVFFLKERNQVGAPVALWPIPPTWVLETPSAQTPGFRLSYGRWQTIIPSTEMLWMRNNNPVQPYGRGTGIARSLDEDIATDQFATAHSLAHFRNSARPDLLIMPKEGGQLGDPERERLEQWWTDKLQGHWRRFKPLFLTRPMDVTVIDQNFRDMQLIELREHERNTIFSTWGISPEILGILQNSNKATIDKAMEIYAQHALVPRLERMRESLQERLVPDYDDRLILAYDSPVPSDKDYTLGVFRTQPAAFELNEYRALAGLSPKNELVDQYGTGSPTGGVTPTGDMPPAAPPKGELEAIEHMTDEEVQQLYGLVRKAGVR